MVKERGERGGEREGRGEGERGKRGRGRQGQRGKGAVGHSKNENASTMQYCSVYLRPMV